MKEDTLDLIKKNEKIVRNSLTHILNEMQMLMMGNKIYQSQFSYNSNASSSVSNQSSDPHIHDKENFNSLNNQINQL